MTTLVIADWESRCSTCGGNADPAEAAHTSRLTALEGQRPRRGCGARWTTVAAALSARTQTEQWAEQIAWDLELPYVGRAAWPRPVPERRVLASDAAIIGGAVLLAVACVGLSVWGALDITAGW